MVIALIVGLVATGCGGSSKARPETTGGTSSSRVWKPGMPDSLGPVVAIVGDRRIRAHEIDSLIETAPQNIRAQLREPEGYKNIVDRIVTEEAIYRSAKKSGLEKDPAYQAAAAKAARETLMRMFYQQRVSALAVASDSAVEAFYQSHQSAYRVPARIRIRHIQVATRAKAEALRKRLLAGALWDNAARTTSTDKTTRDNGGVLGFVTPDAEYVPGIGKAPEIAAAAFKMKEGETSKPLKSERGWHLIRVDNSEPERIQPLAEVRQGIVGHIATETQDSLSQVFLDSLKTASGAVVFTDSIAVALRPARAPQDYFKEAQAAASADQRIDLYRKLVAQFPDDSVSIQAQFMIGFTYAEDLGDYDHAREEFRKFIAAHPKSELVNSALWMMENMDKPAPELKDTPEGSGSTGAPPDSVR